MKSVNLFIYSNQRSIRILRHLLFWIVDIINWMMVLSLNKAIEARDIYIFLCSLPLVVAATYLCNYYLIPKFSRENAWEKLFIGILITIVFMGTVLSLARFYILLPIFDNTARILEDGWKPAHAVLEIFRWLAVISMAIAIKLIKMKTELQQQNTQLQEEKKKVELNFLKAQMHPHFLFNTLNTLYADELKESERGGNVVLHLSNLLRFILEECNQSVISIDKEVKAIRDYIALEKLRHRTRLAVKFEVGEVQSDVFISPLLFLPFVENSFKHSLQHIRGQVNIEITIRAENNNVYLSVLNDAVKNNHNGTAQRTPTGNQNIKRQLDILYGEDYTFVTEDEEQQYRVSLRVPAKRLAHA